MAFPVQGHRQSRSANLQIQRQKIRAESSMRALENLKWLFNTRARHMSLEKKGTLSNIEDFKPQAASINFFASKL
jgi:hypothetical protein